jgi:hypothetical protein
MSKKDNSELNKFLDFYPEKIQSLFNWLREFVWDMFPKSNELIYDNYNALAVGWSVTDKLGHTFCSIAGFSEFVHFGFYWGSQISDPEKRLMGKGKQYRYIIVRDKKDFPKMYMRQLLKEAYANSAAKVNENVEPPHSLTIVKCSLAKKRRPGGLIIQEKKKSKTTI